MTAIEVEECMRLVHESWKVGELLSSHVSLALFHGTSPERIADYLARVRRLALSLETMQVVK